MTTLLIEETSYKRLKDEIKAISPNIDIVLIGADATLRMNDKVVEAESIKPDLAWLSVEVFLSGLMERFINLVQDVGTIKWLQTFMAGLDAPFYGVMLKKGIRITKGNAQAISIAEYVLANVMAHFQGIFERRQNQISHGWRLTWFRELWHTKWLIVGFGNIGQEIAKRVRAFDCEVIGVRRTAIDHPLADAIITLDRVFEYLPQTDVIVLACALNNETRGLANMEFFRKMKKQATFVNIARGQLVNQLDMIEALKDGTLARAVLDVFDPEPLEPDSPLWDMENVIITPHSSSAGSGTQIRGDKLFLDNLRCFLTGQPLINEADPGLIWE